MSGKYDLFNRLLAEWSTGPVVISTGRTAEKIRQDYETITGRDGDDVIVIDCITHEQGDKRDDTPTTKYVASAGNLTDIGIKFTDVVESSAGRDRAVGVYSLSQLLMYWDPERIYRFTRVMTSQTSGGDGRSSAWSTRPPTTSRWSIPSTSRSWSSSPASRETTESSASAAGSGSPPNGPRSRRLVAFSSDYPTSLNLAPSGGPSGSPVDEPVRTGPERRAHRQIPIGDRRRDRRLFEVDRPDVRAARVERLLV